MRKILTLAFIISAAIPCLAAADTLSGDLAFIEAVKKAEEANIKAKEAAKKSEKAAAEFKKAAEELKEARKELEVATKACDEESADPKKKADNLKAYSAAAWKAGEKIDNAALAEDRAKKAQAELDKAMKDLKNANALASKLKRK
jgi:DNA repair ATPase RecN